MEQMNMPLERFRLRRVSNAFTLIELLVVMAIMVMLMALVIPVTSSMMENNNLGRAGQIVADQIRVARQMASSGNRSIEVRFIKPHLVDNGFSAVQLYQYNPRKPVPPMVSSTAVDPVPVGRQIALPAGAAIAQGLALSGILAICTSSTMSIGGAAADYSGFQIKPSGLVSTGTNPMNTIFLTVVPARPAVAGPAPTVASPNKITIQVNPNTGSPLIFRP